jgi:hypothetical protein
MGRRLVLLLAAAGLALVLVQAAAADQTFTDTTGDATGGAADVGNVSVANDTTIGTRSRSGSPPTRTRSQQVHSCSCC